MIDKGDLIVIGKDSKYPIEVTVYSTKATIDILTESNMEFAIGMIEKEQLATPLMFVYTKDKMFILPLSIELATDTKSSAADQVVPLLKTFKLNEDRTGKILGYQVIFEAWMSRAKMPDPKKFIKKYKYGDIAKMEDRVDALLNVVNINKKDLKTEIYEQQKLESEDKVRVKKLSEYYKGKGQDWEMPKTNPKFPNFDDLEVEY